MQSPKVSIGMPVYNGEKYLREAIRSLLEQDYTDFELIIADNASTDLTGEICHRLALADERIRYIRNGKNIGASPNFGLVLSLARGEYFKWACADDMHYPGNLRRTVEVLSAASPEVVLVTPRIFLIDEEGRSLMDENGLPLPKAGLGPGDKGPERISTSAETPSRRLAEVLPRLDWSSAQFGLFRTEALRKTRGIDSFFASDRVLLAEVAMLGKIVEIDEPLFARRQHAEISTTVHKTPGAYALWMDPTAKGRAIKRRPIMSLEYVRSIRRLPLTPLERGLCLGVITGVWLQQKVRRFLGLKDLRTVSR
jgi:glycosyltransferase involved in cell wall biosynthesis